MIRSQFLKNLIVNNLSQGLQYGSRWLLNIVLIAVLTIEDFALYSFIYSLSNFLVAIIPFGSAVFLISKKYGINEANVFFKDSLVVMVSLFLILLLLYMIMSPFLEGIIGWEYIIYGLVLGFVLSLNLILFSLFKGLGKFINEFYAYTFFSIFLLIFIGYVHYFSKGENIIITIFYFLILLNSLLFGVTLLFTFKKSRFLKLKNYNLPFKKFPMLIKERGYFGMQETVTAIYTQAGLLLLFYVLDNTTYGYYRAFFVIILPVFLTTVAISQVLLNRLKNMGIEQMISFFRKIQVFTLILGFLLVTLLFILKDLIFEYIDLEENITSNISFYILIATVFMRFIFGNYEMFLVVIDKQKQRFWVMFVAAVASIGLIFLILPKFGLIGAVSINAISYLVVLIGTLFIAEVKIKHLST